MAEKKKTPKPERYRMVLEFEDAETALQALEHIGDEDAPVFLLDGALVTPTGESFTLWHEYDKARDHLAAQT